MNFSKKFKISDINKEIPCPQSFPSRNIPSVTSIDRKNSLSLSDLPSEIILLIFEYLYPSDLIAFTKLGDKRLSDLTYSIEYANLSSPHKVDAENVSSFFCRNRVKVIRRINFNSAKYLRPHVITGIACRCKNLIELSVVNSNINYQNLIKILKNCKSLEKLSWNIIENIESNFKIDFPSVKTVNLFVEVTFSVSLLHIVSSVYSILNTFPEMKIAWIYFTIDPTLTLPYIGPWVKVSCLTNSDYTKKFMIITNGFKFLLIPSSFERNFVSIEDYFAVNKQYKENYSSENVPVKGCGIETFAFSTYVQIKSNFESLSLLTRENCDFFSTVSIFLTPEIIAVSEKLVEYVTHKCGLNLKQLSLIEGEDLQPKSSHEIIVICDVLEKILQISIYITDLNLISVHFDKASPFKAICNLRFLKTLIIPSCAFPKFEVVENQVAIQFKDVVNACPSIENFSLTFCSKYADKLDNVALTPMHKWEDLKKLSLYCISLQNCHFLRKISETCQKLESLSLISFTFCAAIYVPDIIYFLQHVKSLKFIQINDEKFNPIYERFWDSISRCVNLEGICILTEFSGYIEKQKVLKYIQKLKYLQTFHFYAPRVSEQLYFDIKKSMHNSGVVNFSVFKSISSKMVGHNLIHDPVYVHSIPNYCCLKPHFLT